MQLQAKDLLLLCSDGPTNMVPVESRWSRCWRRAQFYDLPDRLVDAAGRERRLRTTHRPASAAGCGTWA